MLMKNTSYSQETDQDFVFKISGGYVTFGTWDILGYGFSTSFQKSVIKRPRMGLSDIQIGGELFFETGSTGTQMIGDSYADVSRTYATNTTPSLWAKVSYFPINKIAKGLYISVGPTVGYKNQINSSLLNIVHDFSNQIYRKEIIDLKQVKSMYLGYRLSFGYDFHIKNKIIGLKADFNNNTFGDINLFVGASLGMRL